MNKVFYEVDSFNRLIARNLGKASRLKKFRQVVYGRFRIDEGNAFYYDVNKSSGIDIPQKIKFSGRYFLDKEHNFIITLNKWNNQCEGNRLTLKTKIIDVKSNEIALLVNSKINENKNLTYIIKLYGSWQADRHNRLTFGVEKENNKTDALTLSGAWEVNKNNEIVYEYGKGEDSQVLTFKGHWDVRNKYRLKYILDKKTNSEFCFKSSLGTVTPRGKEAYVVFDIGIGLASSKKLRRKIIFSSRWKMAKGKELVLETSDTEESALTIRFTKEMFDRQGVTYIESIIRDKERFLGGGMAFRW